MSSLISKTLKEESVSKGYPTYQQGFANLPARAIQFISKGLLTCQQALTSPLEKAC